MSGFRDVCSSSGSVNVMIGVSNQTRRVGLGPATASAVLAAYAPNVAPFMSERGYDEGQKREASRESKDGEKNVTQTRWKKKQDKFEHLLSFEKELLTNDVDGDLFDNIEEGEIY